MLCKYYCPCLVDKQLVHLTRCFYAMHCSVHHVAKQPEFLVLVGKQLVTRRVGQWLYYLQGLKPCGLLSHAYVTASKLYISHSGFKPCTYYLLNLVKVT